MLSVGMRTPLVQVASLTPTITLTLTCCTSYLERYVNQTGYKVCNETKLDMVLDQSF